MPFLFPPEIISNIATYLATDDPFAPPSSLFSFLATSRHLFATLHPYRNNVLWSTAFRYRFDVAAVKRRNFHPTGCDYVEQLREYTRILNAIRSRNLLRDDIDDIMSTIYIMLLENNGKNRTQLEFAGLDTFVDIHLRTRLWSQAHNQQGWPEDSKANACALWIIWMMSTQEKLRLEATEQPQHREHIVTLLLPYVLNPYRYHQAEAPPGHFHLPLPGGSHTNFLLQSHPSAHGPYPVYVNPPRIYSLPYFGAFPPFSPPPITIAAKLLYFARREIIPFGIPNHLPRTRAEAPPSAQPSPTQEDIREANSHQGAAPPPRITWDWDSGNKLINGVPVYNDEDESKRWDCEYWRRRLCSDVWSSQPRWRPGRVYVPGSMDGLWQGRLIFPAEQSMRHLAGNALFPQQGFNEIALTVTHQPTFMRLKEHHATHAKTHIPFPTLHPGLHRNHDFTPETNMSMRNAWFPGLPGSLDFMSHPNPPSNSHLHSTRGENPKVLVTIDGQVPQGTSNSPYTHERNGWIYETFDRQLAAERRKEMERDGRVDDPPHPDHENCEMCREREELIRRGKELDEADSETIHRDRREAKWWMSDEDWEQQERIFSSVGLGRDQTSPISMGGGGGSNDDEEEEEEDGSGDEDQSSDMGMDQSGSGSEGEYEEDEESNYISDPNADSISAYVPCVRRGTDRAKIEPCDGIRDIILSGSTDRRHALAWNDFTFYGRVRPWDGMIGILRRSYWPAQHFIFFYGYLVGDETFVGSWRVGANDPSIPTWESAFVMSRRKDEDD